MRKCRVKYVGLFGVDSGVLVARLPTGDVTGVGGEVPWWFLWARALHWSRWWWYQCKIARRSLFTIQIMIGPKVKMKCE